MKHDVVFYLKQVMDEKGEENDTCGPTHEYELSTYRCRNNNSERSQPEQEQKEKDQRNKKRKKEREIERKKR